MPELLDIVNERDEVVGQRALSDILRLDLIIRVSHVWIVNNQKQFLLHCQSNDIHIDASAGTRVQPGETYEAAAVRKIEEMGVPSGELVQGSKYFVDIPGLHIFVQVYLVRANGALTLQPGTYEWLSLADFEAKIKRQPHQFVPNIMQSLNAVRDLL